MRKITILICWILFLSFSLYAQTDDKSFVENLLKNTTQKAISILKDKKLTEKEKKDRIYELVNPLFDFNIMARLTLGRKYWNKMTPEQKEKFLKLFKKRIRMVYLDRVTLKEVTYKIKPAIQKKKRIIFVPAIFTSEGKDYSTLFKFWKSKKGWKIYDVEIEGVSIIRTYKSQFNQILSKGTIDDLLKKLESNSDKVK